MATKYRTAVIGRHQAEGIFHAVRFAHDKGRPLNLLVTINLSMLGFADEAAGDQFRNIWNSVVRWWSYQRSKGRELGSFDAYAVHENPNDIRNVHWLIYAPANAISELIKVVEKRVCKMAGLDSADRALHFLPVTKAGGLTKYALKGVDPNYAGYFHMVARDQGTVADEEFQSAAV